MDNCNIFTHSPKELTTDGFLTWLFFFLDSNAGKYGSEKQILFDSLILKPDDRGKHISNVFVNRQVHALKGRLDILLNFTLDGKKRYVLFEDKTWSTTSRKQLGGYKSFCSLKYEMYDYIFLKLGYISANELAIANEYDYRIVSAQKLKSVLASIQYCHPFIEHYYKYLEDAYCHNLDSIEERINKSIDGDIFSDPSAQKRYMEAALKEIKKENISATICPGTSFGKPWVELNFGGVTNISTEYNNERLFWRLDKRGNFYHLRLVQYSSVGEINWEVKRVRLSKIREMVNNIIKNNYPDIILSKPSVRGRKSNDIVVLLFKDNKPTVILNYIGTLTQEIYNQYALIK